MKILFFGDSITDACRYNGNERDWPIDELGCGFVLQVASRLYEKSPDKYDIINRGISGNRVTDLLARLKRDVLNEKPDMISILIGINDIWHKMYGNGVEVSLYKKVYNLLIEEIRTELPDTKIIICEPFVTAGFETTGKEVFDSVPEYAEAAREIAENHGLYFLPLQKVFDEAIAKKSAELYVYDGVHPTHQGGILIAGEWLKLFGKIEN